MTLGMVFRNFLILLFYNQNLSIMRPLLNSMAVLLLLVCTLSLQGQNMNEQQQKAYMNYMTPGSVHQWMAKGV